MTQPLIQLKRFDGPRGRVEWWEHDSTLLVGNPLGDPTRRVHPVYLPAGYDDEGTREYPVLYALAGYTGSGAGIVSWKNFTENLPERLDRLIDEQTIPPVVVVMPDAFTSLGGNQYINSSALGPYADYLTQELVPGVEGHVRVRSDREGRGVFGKSSGGYGALLHGMLYPEVWGHVACHSGDAYFEYGYKPDFPLALDVLAQHGGSVSEFCRAFSTSVKPRGSEIHTLMIIAMAATYDPDPAADLGFHLPFDLETGEVIAERWSRWLAWDPVERVANDANALKQLRSLFIDCGTRDQYRLHHGARILHRRLEQAGVPHEYQEFDDDHSGLDYRYDVSLPYLTREW